MNAFIDGGISQKTKMIRALDPDYVSVEERTQKELIEMAKAFAEQLKFFDLSDTCIGNWKAFFDVKDEACPHTALFLTFLRLLRLPAQKFNQLTKRHLDFYYRDVLGLKNKDYQPDMAYAVFRPYAKIKEHTLEKGTLLKAGKDKKGKDINFAIDRDITVTKACVDEAFIFCRQKLFGKDKILGLYEISSPNLETKETQDKKKQIYRPGFAVSSPVLCMTQAARTISLTILCASQSFDLKKVQNAIDKHKQDLFEIYVMAGGKKIFPDKTDIYISTDRLDFKLYFSEQKPPFSIYPAADKSSWPAIYVQFAEINVPVKGNYNRDPLFEVMGDRDKNELKNRIILYDLLQDIKVKNAYIKTKVNGIEDIIVRNDDLSADIKKETFPIFGRLPKKGSSIYIANPQICRNRLDSVEFCFDWQDIPQDFEAYYKAYTKELYEPIIKGESFKVSLKIWDKTRWLILEDKHLIFTENKISDDKTSVLFTGFDSFIDYKKEADLEAGYKNPLDYSRYLKLELDGPDLKHSIYQKLISDTIDNIQQIKADIRDTAKTDKELSAILDKKSELIKHEKRLKALKANPPYTPTVKKLSINYTASDEAQIMHINPFSVTSAYGKEPFLLPQYSRDQYLFIGIKDLEPKAAVSLLFNISKGTSLYSQNIRWSYLTKDSWEDLNERQIISDTTNNLSNTGIIEFSIPKQASIESNVIKSGLHWIRASVIGNKDSFLSIKAIWSQAVKAVFKDKGNLLDHLVSPLPANTIQSLAVKEPDIAEVLQPYQSFGGRPKESDRRFFTRVSHIISHKKRAITRLDYERLILERFPEIFMVRCLSPKDIYEKGTAGQVVIVIVPNICSKTDDFSIRPVAPASFLEEIEKYIKQFTSEFVQIKVKNACYQEVTYRFSVKFKHHEKIKSQIKMLNLDINRYIWPWTRETDQDFCFGNCIKNSDLIKYIESRPYVHYAANLELFNQIEFDLKHPKAIRGEPMFRIALTSLDCGCPDRADAVLLSAPKHIIDPIYTEDYDPALYEGVGSMILGLDFKPDADQEPIYEQTKEDVYKQGIGTMQVGSNFGTLGKK